MEVLTGLLVMLLVYVWFLFLDRFFKSCSHYGYVQFLNGTGLEVGVFQIKWTTNAFNRLIYNWALKFRILNVWFDAGVYTTLMLLPVAIVIVLMAFFNSVFGPSGRTGHESTLITIEPLLPGLNLPVSELGYYCICLLCCSVIHEMGHALAAVNEDVNIQNFGAHLFLFIPVAYVVLNSEKVTQISAWKRLRIFCGGIWHNLLTALLAYLLILCLPYILAPFYAVNDGVTVTWIAPKSPLLGGAKGFQLGDVITKIDDCPVTDDVSWTKCLHKSHFRKAAICIDSDMVHNMDESVHARNVGGAMICCRPDSTDHVCFEYLDGGGTPEAPPYVCLPARTVMVAATNHCTTFPHVCPAGTLCFKAALANTTNLLQVTRRFGDQVIFIGPVTDLLRTITISPFVSYFRACSTTVADVASKLLTYFVVFSVGLAIVNAFPCVFLDGQHIIRTIIAGVFTPNLSMIQQNIVSSIITVFFTFTLVIHCLLVVWNKISVG